MRPLLLVTLSALTLFSIAPALAIDGPGSEFDSGTLANEAAFSHTFNETGTYAYHCSIHPSMRGSVTVVDTAGANTSATASIQSFKFAPNTVTIAKGGAVTWTNMDAVGHTVTSDAGTGPHGGGAGGGAAAGAAHKPAAAGLAANATFDHVPPEKAAQGLARADAAKLFGKLDYANGSASGRFVSFHWSDATGELTDLRDLEMNETIFSSVKVAPWTMDKPAAAHGAVFHAYGVDELVSVHNDPTIGLHVATGGNESNVTFTIAAGWKMSANSTDRVIVLTNATGARHGHLILLGNATSTNATGTITVHLGADDGVLFLAHPGKDTAAANDLHGVVAAASAGHLGTVLDVADAGDGTPVEDELPLAAHAATKTLAKGHANVTVSSDTSAGKTIVIRFTALSIHAGAVNVTVAGETFAATNVTGQDVSAAVQALQAAGKGATVAFTENSTEVIVQVPHFSDQTVSVDQVDSTTGTSTTGGETTTTTTTSSTPAATKGTPGFEVVALVAAIAGLGLLLRRRPSA